MQEHRRMHDKGGVADCTARLHELLRTNTTEHFEPCSQQPTASCPQRKSVGGDKERRWAGAPLSICGKCGRPSQPDGCVVYL